MTTEKKKRQRKQPKTAAVIRSSRPLWREQFLDIKTSRNKEEHQASRCIVVTPRAVGNAVQRNKIKRRIRSIHHQLKLATTERHWIFFCKKGATTYSFQEIEIFIKNACTRLKKITSTLPTPAETQNKAYMSSKKVTQENE